MAWNPSPEVAAVRDAAVKLNSPFAVIIYLSDDGHNIGMASYGKTRALCSDAAKFGQYLFEKAKQWGAE